MAVQQGNSLARTFGPPRLFWRSDTLVVPSNVKAAFVRMW
jgi:hypothetical protein